jgi:diguanylate cyclase (GGDEF)-like protein
MAGAGSIIALLVIPGTDASHPEAAVVLSLFGLLWGAACAFFIPWRRTRSQLLFHIPAVLCLPYIGLATAFTGGAESPSWLTLVIVAAWCCYFLPTEQSVVYTIAAVVIGLAPLVYDPSATDSGFPGYMLIGIPTMLSVAGIIVIGKRQLVDLRDLAEFESMHDALTGLPNRRALAEELESHVGGTRASDKLALMIVDLDDFKDANTLYGMPGGDAALRATADALFHITREGDLVARLGGDEFAILIRNSGQVELYAIARRVLRAINQASAALAAELPGFVLKASVGWARYPEDAASIDELIAVADLSLRGAKAAGKGGVQSPVDWLPEPTRA